MKACARNLLSLLLILVLLGCGSALAAEDAGVAVQLDGKLLSFTDAVPQVKQQRTFLPFRAVFEAMGAEVGNEGTTITAKRGDKTLTMVIGSVNAVVTENGVETAIVMDVAPYVDNTTWRTYVPVRFAAQAFDCAVGWDQAGQTAILVDTEKLLEEVKAGKSFTYMEKYLAYSQKYSSGLWDLDMSFDGTMTIGGAPIGFAGTADGAMDGNHKLDMDMAMTLDLTGYLDALYAQAEAAGTPMEPLTAEEKAQLEQLAREGVGMTLRADLTRGSLYMNLTGALLELTGMDKNVWYSLDMAAQLEQSGITLEALQSADYETVLKTALSGWELTDSSTGYAQLKLLAEKAAQLLSDASFTKKGNTVTNRFTYSESGVSVEIALVLTMKNNAVAGYELTAAVSLADEENGTVAMDIWAAMDEKDRGKAELGMRQGAVMDMSMNLTSGYTRGTTVPDTQPPAGAVIIPCESLLEPAA